MTNNNSLVWSGERELRSGGALVVDRATTSARWIGIEVNGDWWIGAPIGAPIHHLSGFEPAPEFVWEVLA
jgi:hypothetical protein